MCPSNRCSSAIIWMRLKSRASRLIFTMECTVYSTCFQNQNKTFLTCPTFYSLAFVLSSFWFPGWTPQPPGVPQNDSQYFSWNHFCRTAVQGFLPRPSFTSPPFTQCTWCMCARRHCKHSKKHPPQRKEGQRFSTLSLWLPAEGHPCLMPGGILCYPCWVFFFLCTAVVVSKVDSVLLH